MPYSPQPTTTTPSPVHSPRQQRADDAMPSDFVQLRADES